MAMQKKKNINKKKWAAVSIISREIQNGSRVQWNLYKADTL